MAKKKAQTVTLALRRALISADKTREVGTVLGEITLAPGVSESDFIHAINIDGLAVLDDPPAKAKDDE